MQGQFQDSVASGYQIPPNKAKKSGNPGRLDLGLFRFGISDCFDLGFRIVSIWDFGLRIADLRSAFADRFYKIDRAQRFNKSAIRNPQSEIISKHKLNDI
ncbi:hypothetical protein D1AOALGA4SA_9613 [Olavius algarvensis Delta 1 endosymbiont]|nr:hypothetical protein D1AOALGA4SA_9613 [Olavius algarvensis Delta 1 endosymbiont]